MTASSRFDNTLRLRLAWHPQQTHITPPYVLGPVLLALGGPLDLDPCTLPDNPLHASEFYTPPQDGLSLPWGTGNVFVNPPYGKAKEPWVLKCVEAARDGARVVLLIPSQTDTRIFHVAMDSADAVVFIRGRVKFGQPRPNGRQVAASHPSALIGWNTDLAPCGVLGRVVQLKTEAHP